MSQHPTHRQATRERYHQFIADQAARFPREELLSIDLHCHDRNSDVPDELWGRILRIPETWLPTEDLVRCLKNNGSDVITITNHNNARSCWELMDKGFDVLSGAEFTCTFPDLDLKIHVLCYGFTPHQETRLNELRRDFYKFREYTLDHDLPLVMPHPLYFYNPNNRPPFALFEKAALMFESFEVLNGQRDIRQNMLTMDWIKTLTPEKLEALGRKHGIRPDTFCKHPYRKRITGGSDDHMGLFAGACGTMLHVPGLVEKRKTMKGSELALEALLNGEMVPFGQVADEEKLSLAIMDYFCQVALNMDDPGLIRMFLHNGTYRDKLWCLGIANAILELKRHKTTMTFLEIFHDAMGGKRPARWLSWRVPKEFKPLLTGLREIAGARGKGPEVYLETLTRSIEEIYRHMLGLLFNRLSDGVGGWGDSFGNVLETPDDLVNRLEVPSHLRGLFSGNGESSGRNMTKVNVGNLLDNLSFPLLATGVMAGSSYVGTRVLNSNNEFLNTFERHLGLTPAPGRLLWLTDTLTDRNGVSSVLQVVLEEVRRHDLPIDFLVCGDDIEAGPHLKVVPAVTSMKVSAFGGHEVRVPDLLEVMRLFRDGGYDRVLCSTELIMGPVALFLKSAFKVPAKFYMHTDWMDFVARNTNLEERGLDRVRRLMRAVYKRFDGIFVLNREHQQWLTGPAMGISKGRIHLTAHWVDDFFTPRASAANEVFPGLAEDERVLLYAGRLSREKGVMDLPRVLEGVRRIFPKTRLAFAGTGPCDEELKRLVPDGIFLGWVDRQAMPELYSAADLLLLPSRFDTFGCVVLEAMSCACPVVAYDTKGPRDLIRDGVNGVLCNDPDAMIAEIIGLFTRPEHLEMMAQAARERSSCYTAGTILSELLRDVGLAEGGHDLEPEEDTGSLMAELLELVS